VEGLTGRAAEDGAATAGRSGGEGDGWRACFVARWRRGMEEGECGGGGGGFGEDLRICPPPFFYSPPCRTQRQAGGPDLCFSLCFGR
jgi:hypothetical protein